jgi:hypothetical protein
MLLVEAQPGRTAEVRDPYARWCGRGGAARRPSIPIVGPDRRFAALHNSGKSAPTSGRHAQGGGLNAIAEGFRHLGFKNDHDLIAAEAIVYDALYGYCQEMVRRGKPDGQFR